jgi:hypothetical protein
MIARAGAIREPAALPFSVMMPLVFSRMKSPASARAASLSRRTKRGSSRDRTARSCNPWVEKSQSQRSRPVRLPHGTPSAAGDPKLRLLLAREAAADDVLRGASHPARCRGSNKAPGYLRIGRCWARTLILLSGVVTRSCCAVISARNARLRCGSTSFGSGSPEFLGQPFLNRSVQQVSWQQGRGE